MKDSTTTKAFVRLLLGATALTIVSPALAQEAQDDAGASAQLEDIVVTAQKREQNLQVVPISISAISSEKVERLGVTDARDISGMAPNVTIVQGTTSNSAAVISIRGIPTPASETFGLDSANGLYVDGVYMARSGASALDVMDIERVEVLRGPQGTLFGRNTTGGGIAFISRAPSKEFRLKVEGGYGNYNALNGRITLDPGEIAGVSTSFTYSHRERNGTVDNILQRDDALDPGSRRTDAVRAAARADLGATGSIQYIFDWSKTDGSPINFQLTNTASGALRPSIVLDGGALLMTQQAAVAPYLAAATFANPECAALAAPTRVWRERVCNDVLNSATDQVWGHNLQVKNDFGAFAVKSTTGYRIWHSDSVNDLDGIGAFSGPAFTNASLFNGFPAALLGNLGFPAATAGYLSTQAVPRITQNLFDTNGTRRHKQFSQEVEVSGDTDNLDWVLGGFYFWEKGTEYNPQNSGFVLNTNERVFADAAFAGVLQGLGFPAATAAQLAPLLAPQFRAANPQVLRLALTRGALNYTARNESKAVYGQATFYPGGRDSGLRLTAGGRYTWDSKYMYRTQSGAAPHPTPQIGDADFKKFTWNLMVGYDIQDGINAYARAATGYRSGGFNASDPAEANSRIPGFKPESVTSYEIGVKSELFNRRVRFNLAGYYNEYKDLAVNIPLTDAPAGTFASRVGNAGKVAYTGVEAELQAVLTDNFTFEGNIGYIDIKYKEFKVGQSVIAGAAPIDIASIVTPAYTSPLTANAALNANFPIGDQGMRLLGRVSYTYEDGKYSFSNSASTPFNEELKGDNRNIVDAQLGLESIPVAGGEAMARLWVKNLTNSHDFARGVDFGQLGYAGGFYADPRTYGLTVGMKF